MKDKFGSTFSQGCKVLRPVLYGKSPHIELATVTRIVDGKIYLDNSKQAMQHPERLVIWEQDKLFQMIDKYGPVEGTVE